MWKVAPIPKQTKKILVVQEIKKIEGVCNFYFILIFCGWGPPFFSGSMKKKNSKNIRRNTYIFVNAVSFKGFPGLKLTTCELLHK